MDFSEWITKKYVEWRGPAIGRERTITEYAEWLGITQQTVSSWMQPDGKVATSKKSIQKLAEKYGDEVYFALGILPNDYDPTDHARIQVEDLANIKASAPDSDELIRMVKDWAEGKGYTVEVKRKGKDD